MNNFISYVQLSKYYTRKLLQSSTTTYYRINVKFEQVQIPYVLHLHELKIIITMISVWVLIFVLFVCVSFLISLFFRVDGK